MIRQFSFFTDKSRGDIHTYNHFFKVSHSTISSNPFSTNVPFLYPLKTWHAPPSTFFFRGGGGVKDFRKVFAEGNGEVRSFYFGGGGCIFEGGVILLGGGGGGGGKGVCGEI